MTRFEGSSVTTLSTAQRSRVLIYTSLAHFVNDGGVFLMPLMFAVLASEQNVTSLTIILLPIVFYGASLLLSVYVANLSDKMERPGLMLGLGLALISTGLLGFAFSLGFVTGSSLDMWIILFTFVAGVGTAFYHPIGAAMLQASYDDRTKGKALGINGAMGSLGRALYPSFFFAFAGILTNNGALIVLAIVGLVCSVVVSLALTQKRDRSASHSAPQRSKRAMEPLSNRITVPLIILTLVAFISAFATQGIAAWIPTYLATQKGYGITSALGLALTGMYAASIVGQPIFGYLVDRYEKRLVLAVSILGSAISIAAYLFAEGYLSFILLILLGFFTFSGYPIFLSLASDYVPKRSSSLSNALVWSLGVNGGGVVGPAVVGAVTLSGYVSWTVAFGIMAVAAFLSAAMILLLRKSTTAAGMDASTGAPGKSA